MSRVIISIDLYYQDQVQIHPQDVFIIDVAYEQESYLFKFSCFACILTLPALLILARFTFCLLCACLTQPRFIFSKIFAPAIKFSRLLQFIALEFCHIV